MIPDTVPKLFFHRVEKYKDRVALRKKVLGIWDKITWLQYGEMVRRVGMGLIALALKPKDRVAIMGESRPEWLYADLGNLSVNGISKFESNAGEREVKLSTLFKLSEVLGFKLSLEFEQ